MHSPDPIYSSCWLMLSCLAVLLLLPAAGATAQDTIRTETSEAVYPIDEAPSAGDAAPAVRRARPRREAPLQIILPTINDAIYNEDGGGEFYQRTARGGPDPWEGGRYGYVRNRRNTSHGVVYSRFHEGVDIRPVERDKAGRPLDSIYTIDKGVVVYANSHSGRSNYGRYVVVEHIWDDSPYYSLYAHMNDVWVETGQQVERGDLLGSLGYTGAGINRARAHLHFEIGLLISDAFDVYHAKYWPRDSNYHGNHNGQNIYGVDVARLYLDLKDNPGLSIQEFIESEPEVFSITIPNTGVPNLLRRYPWMLKGPDNRRVRNPGPGGFTNPSWEIFFASSGLPLRVVPSDTSVEEPAVTLVPETEVAYRYVSKGLLSGHGNSIGLSKYGKRLAELMMLGDPELEKPLFEERRERRPRRPVVTPGEGSRER